MTQVTSAVDGKQGIYLYSVLTCKQISSVGWKNALHDDKDSAIKLPVSGLLRFNLDACTRLIMIMIDDYN